MKTFPRVLIINGEPFNRQSATGVTMLSLFKGWPSNRIAQIYTANISSPDEICNKSWKLGLKDQKYFYYLLKIFAKINYIKCLLFQKGQISTTSELNQSICKGSAARSTIRCIARDWLDIIPYHLDQGFWDWLDSYKPEVIYSCLANIRLIELVNRISEQLSIPVVIHFMDDWPTTKYSKVTYFIQRKILLDGMNKAICRAKNCLAISETMAVEYQKRFGKSFIPFMNCLSHIYQVKDENNNNKDRKLILYYIGNVNHGRLKMIKDIVLVANELDRSGYDIKIHIFAGNLSDDQKYELLVTGNVILETSFEDSYINNIRNNCDCFIHVDSFEEQYRKYFRLSLSTKIPLYMWCGLPILAYGPKDVCTNQYIDSTGAGIVVGEENKAVLLETLRELALNPEKRDRLGRRGCEVANERHNAEKERERFRSVLAEAAVSLLKAS